MSGTARDWSRRTALKWGGSAVAAAALAACTDRNANVTKINLPTAETVRIALSSFGNEQVDPVATDTAVFGNILLAMYDTVIEIGKDAGLAPGIAEAWGVGNDGVTWTFQLRKGVQFHDGWGEVTADDLVFSLNRFMTSTLNVSGSTLKGKIKSLSALGPYTFVIVTNGVQIDLPYYLSPHQSTAGAVMSKKYITEQGGTTVQSQNALMNTKPIGSGPFKFLSQARGANLIFETVPNHWRAKPAMKRLEYLLVAESTTQMAMLRSGQADIIALSADKVEESEANGFETRQIKDGMHIGLLWAGTSRPAAAAKPTAKASVRHALSLAIDRKLILNTVLGGRGSMPNTPFNFLPETVNMDIAHYGPWAREVQRYDPVAAKKMLADAGYPDGFSGLQLFTFTRPGAEIMPQLGELVASQWAQIGVNAKLVAVDFGTYRLHLGLTPDSDTYNAADVSPFNLPTRYEPLGGIDTYYRSGGAARVVRSPQVDDLLAKAQAETDDKKRTDLVSEVMSLVHNEWALTPLFRIDVMYGVNRKNVGPWTAPPGFTYLGRLLETITT